MTQVTRRLIVCVAGVLLTLLTARLGVWQLGRGAEKAQAWAQMKAQSQLPPWRNGDWPCAAHEGAALPLFRHVQLQGRWLPGKTVLLDNRPMDGRSGFVVVTPLQLDAEGSACPGRIVLVERGWLARDPHDRLHVPAIRTPAGPTAVSGRLVAGVSRTYQLGQEPAPQGQAPTLPLLRQNADDVFWQAWLGQSPMAGALQEMEVAGAGSEDGLLRNWADPSSGQDRHLAYAVQWFALAALTAGLTLWFQIIRPRRTKHHVPS